MSSKSDRDNRSNQLNPNNPEYSNCRNHGSSSRNDDDDGFSGSRLRGYAAPIATERTEWTRFYFAALAFDGTPVYVRFRTKVTINVMRRWGIAEDISESAKEVLLEHMQRKCPLGVAYWRLARDGNRGSFYWYTPSLSERGFANQPHIFGKDEEGRMRNWFSHVRKQAQEMDLLFDWEKHDGAIDLGVLTSEQITFAPKSADLQTWHPQVEAST